MINTLKKIVISLVFTLIATFICTGKMECVNAYLDDDGYVCLEMADHQRVNDIHYKTMGFTISRCVYNPCAKQLHSSLDWVGTDFSSIEPASSSDLSGGVYYNTWRVHITQLLQNAGASAEWIKEVEDALSGEGPAVYIRYDSRLMVFIDKAETQYIPGSDNAHFSNYATIDGTNPNEILNCGPGWGGNTQREFAQHYNRYLLIGKIKEPDIPDLTEDEFISAERSPLEFWTGNFSNEWDLYNKNNPYSGIPSGESVSRI